MTSSNTVITPEQFTEEYEEYHDEEGNLVPDMFTQVISVRALANPFDEPIKRINGNGFVLEEFEEDCYFVESNTPNRIEILSGDYFKNEYFLQANAGQAKKSFSKNANNDIH